MEFAHPQRVVLLDLDGTLTKSDPGIIACVIKALPFARDVGSFGERQNRTVPAWADICDLHARREVDVVVGLERLRSNAHAA